jgi:hypothetical protein
MLEIPFHIVLVFILTTLFTLVLFAVSMLQSDNEVVRNKANIISLSLLLWLIFQSTLSLNKWYMDRVSIPPHITFPIAVALVVLLSVFLSKRGKRFEASLSLKTLTWIHIVRLPVELVLLWLSQHKQVPLSMTFHGFNFDIVFGITAPIMAGLYFNRKKISKSVLLIWNVLGIISLATIVVIAAGAAPTAMQQWDFQTPNYAITHFPFIWLPSFIVPIVLFAHIKAIRQLRRAE